jgi:hypothetical protein
MAQPFVDPLVVFSAATESPIVMIGCTSASPLLGNAMAPVFLPGWMCPPCVHVGLYGSMVVAVVLNQRASSEMNCTTAMLTESSCGQPCGNEMRAYRQTSTPFGRVAYSLRVSP